MGRSIRKAVAVAAGALAIAGCGADSTDPPTTARAPGAVPAPAVEPTEGRLGDATLQRPGAPQQQLSPGGAPDVRERGGAPRRDGVGAGAACANAGLAPTHETLPAVAEATLCLLNGERADQGLAPVAANGRLTEVATAYAADLVAGSYFSHTGRDGSSVLVRIRRSGYVPPNGSWVLGENLAWGTGALATPDSIMRAWMNSPGHRANILNPEFRDVGVGVVIGNPKALDGLGATFATEFGAIDGEVAEVVRAPRESKQARDRGGKARKRGRGGRRAARHARAATRHGRTAARRGGKARGGKGLHGNARRVRARIAV